MRIAIADLTVLSNAALRRTGLAPDDCAVTSRVLIEADMMGVPTHGVLRLTSYTARLRNGAVNPRAVPELDRRAPSLGIIDGNNAIGPVVGQAALDAALQMVAETGICYVGCRASNHFGAMLPYARLACDAGMMMIAGTGASTTIPPWGGAEARLGNNPLCIAAPCDEPGPFMLDMALSVAARGKIRAARDAGRPIPEGWAVDATGKPTTDPAAALDGFLIAIGGHKGSGLSMAIDLLAGVASGAGYLNRVKSWSADPDQPQGIGHFFILIDPARLLGAGAYRAAMRDFASIVLATPPSDPAQPVRLPGQLEMQRFKDALQNGVEIPDAVLDEVRALGAA